VKFGRIRLHLISAGIYLDDGGVLFGLVPKPLWERIEEPDDQNRLPVEMRCLLVETCSHLVLVGTGLGDDLSEAQLVHQIPNGKRRLMDDLGALGIGAEEIDLLINTHLHSHHSGGNTIRVRDGGPLPAFPKALYCVQRLELADAWHAEELAQATYRREDYAPLEEAGRLRVLLGNTRLTSEVRVVVTPGHTRAHQSVIIESGGRVAMFLGDVAPWPIHMERLAWVSAYDLEPMVTIETKRNLARWAVENRALLIFEHHPEIAAGYLHKTERSDRFRLEPVEI
jgi:glyoxylase-like metal-dependent hydrolase (beta-lactamase superfamily II)